MVKAKDAVVEGGWTVLARISTSRLKASWVEKDANQVCVVRRSERDERTLVTFPCTRVTSSFVSVKKFSVGLEVLVALGFPLTLAPSKLLISPSASSIPSPVTVHPSISGLQNLFPVLSNRRNPELIQ